MKYRHLWHPKDQGIVLGTKPPCSNTPESELDLEEPKPNQNKGCTHLPLYEGLVSSQIREGDHFLYLGEVVGGLIDFGKYSSDLRDEPPLRKIVYVQPIEQAKCEQWNDGSGISVFLDQLKILDLQNFSNNNHC